MALSLSDATWTCELCNDSARSRCIMMSHQNMMQRSCVKYQWMRILPRIKKYAYINIHYFLFNNCIWLIMIDCGDISQMHIYLLEIFLKMSEAQRIAQLNLLIGIWWTKDNVKNNPNTTSEGLVIFCRWLNSITRIFVSYSKIFASLLIAAAQAAWVITAS